MCGGETSVSDDVSAVSQLDYELPDGLIAQKPTQRREDARTLTVDRAAGAFRDERIIDLPNRLQPGDLLVLNDTRVVPARIVARRATGGVVRGLFVREESPGRWRVMLEGSRRLREGETLTTAADARGSVTLHLAEPLGKGDWRVCVEPVEPADRILDRVGRTPLPPYIHRSSATNERDKRDGDDERETSDRERYQTVYAARPGAIAAPTAGLHLTRALLGALRDKGVEIAFVTLHVGPGTFQPIACERLADHVMHEEWYELNDATASAIRACRRRDGRVVAVGTTSLRVLEASARSATAEEVVRSGSATTDLFIRPPYEFAVVDALLTNFHLPRSTLLALVMAFAGVERTRRAYQHAIDHKYRFYSYGDAMLIA
jgi:S-adenosylmethionine:tRNA ribosyltransferase-isomerase